MNMKDDDLFTVAGKEMRFCGGCEPISRTKFLLVTTALVMVGCSFIGLVAFGIWLLVA